jgi:hypothetical protein
MTLILTLSRQNFLDKSWLIYRALKIYIFNFQFSIFNFQFSIVNSTGGCMRNHCASLGIGLLLIIGLAGSVSALPEYRPVQPFVFEHKPDQLTVFCGIPDVFDSVDQLGVSGLKSHAAFVPSAEIQPPSAQVASVDPQAVSAAVPEPTTLVLLGLGLTLIGILRWRTRRRE